MATDGAFLEIPVYRVPAEVWRAEIDARVARRLAGSESANPGRDEKALRRERLGGWEIESHGEDWRYNQIVGWVRLEWDGGERVKGYAFKLPQQRVNRHFTRTYEWQGKVLDAWFPHGATNQQIASEIKSDLLSLTQKGAPFEGRHVDLETFDLLAPHLDWRGVIGLN